MARKKSAPPKEPQKRSRGPVFKELGPIKIHHRLFSLIKLVLGILLLPYVYSVTVSFIKEFSGINDHIVAIFHGGLISCLVVHLFIWEPQVVYEKGQKLVEFIFQFVSPLMKVASYIVPIYTVLLLIVFAIFNLVLKERFVNVFVFLISFSFCFHLILTARVLRNKERDVLKANYLFGFSLVYIINLIIVGLFLNFIFTNFSFVEFINQTYFLAQKIYFTFLNQLFGVR